MDKINDGLVPALHQVHQDHSRLSIMTQACVAEAVIGLEAIPEKMNPILKPLMEAIKKESNEFLQSLAGRKLAKLLEICVQQKNVAPVEKVLKNLIAFASTTLPNCDDRNAILTLINKESEAQRSAPKGRGRPAGANKAAVKDALAVSGEEGNRISAERIQTRGAKAALTAIVKHFHQEIFNKIPKLYQLSIGHLVTEVSTQGILIDISNIILALRALEILTPALSVSLHTGLTEVMPKLLSLLRVTNPVLRHLTSRCFSELATVQTLAVMICVINNVIPLLESDVISERQGAIECLACVVAKVDLDVIPYIVLLIVPVLGKDQIYI